MLENFFESSRRLNLNLLIPVLLLLFASMVSPALSQQVRKIIQSTGSIKYLLYPLYVGANVRFWSVVSDEYFSSNVEALGFNAVRLFIGSVPTSPAHVRAFLDMTEEHGVKTIVTLPTYLGAYFLNGTIDLNKTKQNIYDYIVGGGLKGDPRILAWDIANEPDLGDAQMLQAVREISQYVKSIDPDTAVTIGGWHNNNRIHYPWQHPDDGDLIVDYVDIYSPHIYLEASQIQSVLTPDTPDEEIWKAIYDWWKNRVQQHLNHSMGKPVIIEEFGVNIEWLRQTFGETRAESVEAVFFNATIKAMSETSVKGMLFWTYLIGDIWCPIELGNHWRQAAYVIEEYFTELT